MFFCILSKLNFSQLTVVISALECIHSGWRKNEIDLIPESAFSIKRHQPASCSEKKEEKEKLQFGWLNALSQTRAQTIGILKTFFRLDCLQQMSHSSSISSRDDREEEVTRLHVYVSVEVKRGDESQHNTQTFPTVEKFLELLVITAYRHTRKVLSETHKSTMETRIPCHFIIYACAMLICEREKKETGERTRPGVLRTHS